MRLSIVICAYNVDKYIQECVDSIIFNKIDYEIILVNDCSTDRTKEILDQYKEREEIKLIDLDQNKGVSVARNIGMKHASGEFLIFIDGDDYINSQILEEKIENLIDEEIYIGNFNSIYEDTLNIPYESEFKGLKKDSGEVIFSELFLSSITGSIWKAIYKRDFLLKSNLFFTPDIVIAEDLDWLVKVILEAKNAVFDSEFRFYNYRIRSNSVMRSSYNLKKYNDSLVIVKSIQEIKKNKNLARKTFQKIDLVCFALLIQAIGSYRGKINNSEIISISNEIYLKEFKYKIVKFLIKRYTSILRFLLRFKYK